MKSFMKTLFFLLTIINLTFAGGGMGNGGHPYELIVLKDISEIIEMFKSDQNSIPLALQDISVAQIHAAASYTKIKIKRKKLRNSKGEAKCMLNIPQNMEIHINKKCFEKIMDNEIVRKSMVFHEYLGMIGAEIEHYRITSEIYKMLENHKVKRVQLDDIIKQYEEKLVLLNNEKTELEQTQKEIEQLQSFLEGKLPQEAINTKTEEYKQLRELAPNFEIFAVYNKFSLRIENSLYPVDEFNTLSHFCQNNGYDTYIKTNASSISKLAYRWDQDLNLYEKIEAKYQTVVATEIVCAKTVRRKKLND